MTRQDIMETAWGNRTDCMLINFAANNIVFMRRNEAVLITNSNIEELAEELVNKLVSYYPLEVRACDWLGLVVVGREKGFNEMTKNLCIQDNMKSISELMGTSEYDF